MPDYASFMNATIGSSETILAIDTSGPRLQLALLVADDVDAWVEDLPKGHAEVLFDRIAGLLARNAVTYDDLTRISVTTGPGSFTGLRIGLSAARGLGLAHNIPVIGVPTLLAMSLAAPAGQPVTIAVDARRGEAFRQSFSAPGVPVDKAVLVPATEMEGMVLAPSVHADIAAMTRFAATADPADYPPDPTYVRSADAKPQTGFAVAHVAEASS